MAVRAGSTVLLVDRITFHYCELGEAIRKHRVDAAGNLIHINSPAGRFDLTACDLESMNRDAVAALEYCLEPFKERIIGYGLGY